MIILSAGHNPSAKGACNGIICEHDIAKQWILRIAELVSRYVPTSIVPTGSLTNKVNFINTLPNVRESVAIELHFNANVKAHGSETLYFPGSVRGKELADMFQDEFQSMNIFQPNRGSKEGWYRMDAPHVVDYVGDVDGDEHYDYFLHKTKCTSVIIEPEFMYNLELIEENKEAGCQAIANVLIKYHEQIRG